MAIAWDESRSAFPALEKVSLASLERSWPNENCVASTINYSLVATK